MSTIKSFVKSFVALIQGDDATVKAEKVYRQVSSALSTQIATLTGDLIGKEDAVADAKEALANARINKGELVNDRNAYVRDLLNAKNAVTAAEEALEAHNTKLAFLKDELKNLDAEVEA